MLKTRPLNKKIIATLIPALFWSGISYGTDLTVSTDQPFGVVSNTPSNSYGTVNINSGVTVGGNYIGLDIYSNGSLGTANNYGTIMGIRSLMILLC